MAKLTDTYNLSFIKPDIAKEWHPTKNGNLTPIDVTPCSAKKIWWRCSKGHEWQTLIYNRSRGRGCPYCSSLKVHRDNCLKTVNPSLAREWHPTKNQTLTAKDIKPFSDCRVWWICNKGHEWQTTVNSRSSGSRCPYCTGKKPCLDNCLATVNPKLAKQWHPSLNGKLTPKDVTAGSQKKVWWKCKKGHIWQAIVASRNHGTGCSKCRYIKS